MYFTCVANVTTRNGQMPEFLRKAEVELLPLYHELPGFVSFRSKIDDTASIAWSLWQTLDQAKGSIAASEHVISVGFGSLIDTIQSYVGEMPFSVFTGERAIGTSVQASAQRIHCSCCWSTELITPTAIGSPTTYVWRPNGAPLMTYRMPTVALLGTCDIVGSSYAG